jgi:hypothetical protein
MTHSIVSFWIRVVDSRKRVSWGCILWKTTLVIEDLPLLLWFLVKEIVLSKACHTVSAPSTANEACCVEAGDPYLLLCSR